MIFTEISMKIVAEVAFIKKHRDLRNEYEIPTSDEIINMKLSYILISFLYLLLDTTFLIINFGIMSIKERVKLWVFSHKFKN